MRLPACFLLLLLPLKLTSQLHAAPNSQTSIDCNLYSRPSDTPLTTVLDCRRVAAQFNEASGYRSSRRALVLVRTPDLPTWRLSPPLSSSESINYLPEEAFADLGRTVTTGHLLSLRRLHQRRLNLSAATGLSSLRHLEIADSNATCLPVGLFDGLPHLVSLRLTDNAGLACIQFGALAPLLTLVELRISGSPSLKSLNAASAPQLADLRLADGTHERLAGALCGARALRKLRLDRLPTNALLLAGLSGLQSLDIETDTEDIVVGLSAALCAQWSDGRLMVNGINLANMITSHMLVSYADFCEDQGQREFAEQAKQLCETPAVTDVCLNDCPPVSTPKPAILTSTAIQWRSIMATTFTVAPESSFQMIVTSAPTVSSMLTSTSTSTYSSPPSQGVGGIAWNVEHQSIIGTALLTAGAFLVGALLTAYCCQSRRMRRIKPPASVAAVSVGNAGCGGGVGCVSTTKDEPIRLIGYTIKEAPPPPLQLPARRESNTAAGDDGTTAQATAPLISLA